VQKCDVVVPSYCNPNSNSPNAITGSPGGLSEGAIAGIIIAIVGGVIIIAIIVYVVYKKKKLRPRQSKKTKESVDMDKVKDKSYSEEISSTKSEDKKKREDKENNESTSKDSSITVSL